MNPRDGYLLGIDLGTTSVKVSVVEAETGRLVGSAQSPAEGEIPVSSPQAGWAEQDPELWWRHAIDAVKRAADPVTLQKVNAIGIAYQMHGLVLADAELSPVRPAIIWCDSRAGHCGEQLKAQLGEAYCRQHLFNSPGNLTAAKLKWVADNEPTVLDQAKHALLPGDWLASKLGAPPATSRSGLSEMVLWSFQNQDIASEALQATGASTELIHQMVGSFEVSGYTSLTAARELGIPEGTPISYRAGDQTNNALAVGAVAPGSAMANAGTSGVLYSVSESAAPGLPVEVNRFIHVNDKVGTLLCLNGVGSAYAWLRELLGLEYSQLNQLSTCLPNGESGLMFYPFGNGAERVLKNQEIGFGLVGPEFRSATRAAVIQAVLEGIAFAFRYGREEMEALGAGFSRLRAGRANLFLNPNFGQLLASTLGAPIELVDADGSVGAARGAGVGLGIWTVDEVASMPEALETWIPDDAAHEQLSTKYKIWRKQLKTRWPI